MPLLNDLAQGLGSKLAARITLLEEGLAQKAINAALDAARELLGAIRAETYQVEDSPIYGFGDKVLVRFACSPRKSDLEPSYLRRPIYPVKEKGVWQYVYQKNAPIWITSPNHDLRKVPDEGSDAAGKIEYCSRLDNQIPGKEALPAMYNFADYDCETVITIPLNTGGTGCSGILDIEFDHLVSFSALQFHALQTLAKHISGLLSATKAWKRNESDTQKLVQEFASWCEQINK